MVGPVLEILVIPQELLKVIPLHDQINAPETKSLPQEGRRDKERARCAKRDPAQVVKTNNRVCTWQGSVL